MKHYDLQDALLMTGTVSLGVGIGVISWPACCIIMGLLCFVFVWLIERSKSYQPLEKTGKKQ